MADEVGSNPADNKHTRQTRQSCGRKRERKQRQTDVGESANSDRVWVLNNRNSRSRSDGRSAPDVRTHSAKVDQANAIANVAMVQKNNRRLSSALRLSKATSVVQDQSCDSESTYSYHTLCHGPGPIFLSMSRPPRMKNRQDVNILIILGCNLRPDHARI